MSSLPEPIPPQGDLMASDLPEITHLPQSPYIPADKVQDAKNRIRELLYTADLYKYKGRVTKLQGLLVEAHLPKLKIGDLCFIESMDGEPKAAEVVAFKGDIAQMLLLYDGKGISQGSWVTTTGKPIMVPVGDFLIGRLLSPLCEPMDGRPLNASASSMQVVDAEPPNPLERPVISQKFSTGVRAIDSLLTMGAGQPTERGTGGQRDVATNHTDEENKSVMDLMANLKREIEFGGGFKVPPELEKILRENDVKAFTEYMSRMNESKRKEEEMYARLERDPFDVEAQKEIEKIIKINTK